MKTVCRTVCAFQYVWLHDHMIPSSQLDSHIRICVPEWYKQWFRNRRHFFNIQPIAHRAHDSHALCLSSCSPAKHKNNACGAGYLDSGEWCEEQQAKKVEGDWLAFICAVPHNLNAWNRLLNSRPDHHSWH